MCHTLKDGKNGVGKYRNAELKIVMDEGDGGGGRGYSTQVGV